MSKEMKVVVYQNYDAINWSNYSMIYEGTTTITETTTAKDVFEFIGIEMPFHLYLCLKDYHMKITFLLSGYHFIMTMTF